MDFAIGDLDEDESGATVALILRQSNSSQSAKIQETSKSVSSHHQLAVPPFELDMFQKTEMKSDLGQAIISDELTAADVE